MLKALLLNHNYEFLDFISERKTIKLLLKDKVEVLSTWENDFIFKRINYPAVIKLKYYIKKPIKQIIFSRFYVFKRDNYTCQYCSKILNIKNITLDHVIPRAAGGKTNFLNCVTSCYTCNNDKGGRTPEEASMKLLRKPFVPTNHHLFEINQSIPQNIWHNTWEFYIKKYL